MLSKIKVSKNWAYRSACEGWKGITRNRFLSFSTILLGVLILFLLNFVFSVKFLVNFELQKFESRLNFTVPLRPSYDNFELGRLKNELNNKFDLKVKILEAEKFRDYQVEKRIFLEFKNLEQVSGVMEILKKLSYSEVLEWDNLMAQELLGVTRKLLSIRLAVNRVTQAILALFIVGGFLLTINTFRIVIYNRKSEIFIARLVGAQTKFIVAPFLFEGFFFGFASALIAIISFVFILREVSILPGGGIFLYLWDQVFLYEILFSILIGVFGSWITVKKYLFGSISRLNEA